MDVIKSITKEFDLEHVLMKIWNVTTWSSLIAHNGILVFNLVIELLFI
jgi:hypothetical protein